MSIAEAIKLQQALERIAALEERVAALEDAKKDNTLHLKSKPNGK